MHAAAGTARFGLELVEEPEDFGVVRAAVEDIAEHHQVPAPEFPAELRVDDAVFLQHGDQDFVFAVGICNHEQRRLAGGTDFIGRRLCRAAQFDRERGKLAHGFHGDRRARGQRHRALAWNAGGLFDRHRLPTRAIPQHVGTIGRASPSGEQQ